MSDLPELLELSTGRRATVETPEALGAMLEELARAFNSQRALAALHVPETDVLRGALGLNVARDVVEALEVPLSETADPLAAALLRNAPVRVDDARRDSRLSAQTRETLFDLGIDRFAVVPLSAGEQTVGVVLLASEAPFSDDDLAALVPLTNQAGSELLRARKSERTRDAGVSIGSDVVEREWLWWMINSVADPVVVSDEQNDIVLQNRRAELLFRASPDDSPGKRHAISMNNFLFTASLSTWKLQQDRRGPAGELTLVDPIEGSDLMFEVIARPAVNYRLGMRGMVSVLKNVTELRQVADELSRSAQRLQSADHEIRMERDRLDLILRSVANPIIVVGGDDDIIVLNDAAQRVFGGVEGGPPSDTALRNNAKFTSFLAQLRLDPTTRKTGELALTDPASGEGLEMVVTATEIRDLKGAVEAIVVVMQDVARLRELERRRLEQALFESEKLAATGRLAASIAHEINNPLEAIQNSLYLLVRKVAAEDPNRRFLEIAMKETQRMSRILRQMLGFYRPVASMGETDVNALIEEAETLVAKRMRERRVTMATRLDPALPRITASGDQLKQVMLNLLLNAAEAMPDGGTITVTSGVYRDASATFLRAGAIEIEIRDTGAGIAEEHMPHLFEPFFSTKGERGTGLGLWVSSGIVQSHGGTLKVRSRPGRGTTFSITLPIGGPPSDDE